MGSPVSPVVANLFMEEFEHRALTSAVNPPRLWKRFVDDPFVILLQSTERGVPATHKLCGPFHHSSPQKNLRKMVHAISGHIGNTKRRWNLDNLCVQKAHTH